MIGEILTRDSIGWNDPPGYDRKLGRTRTPSDDFYDQRMALLKAITASNKQEKARR